MNKHQNLFLKKDFAIFEYHGNVFDCRYRELNFDTFKFSGGEVHIKMTNGLSSEKVRINSRINSSDDLMRLMLAVDALREMGVKTIEAHPVHSLCATRQAHGAGRTAIGKSFCECAQQPESG